MLAATNGGRGQRRRAISGTRGAAYSAHDVVPRSKLHAPEEAREFSHSFAGATHTIEIAGLFHCGREIVTFGQAAVL